MRCPKLYDIVILIIYFLFFNQRNVRFVYRFLLRMYFSYQLPPSLHLCLKVNPCLVGEENVGSSDGIYFVLDVLKGYSLPTVFLDVYSSIEVDNGLLQFFLQF